MNPTAAPSRRTVPPAVWPALLGAASAACLGWLLLARLDKLPVLAGAAVVLIPLLVLHAGIIGLLIHGLDRWRTLRAGSGVVALVWGGAVATTLAMPANSAIGQALGELLGAGTGALWAPALSAPLVEETVKGLGVIAAVLVARRNLTGPLEGMLLGALSGLGFQLVENLSYVHDAMWTDPVSDLGGGTSTLIPRMLFGVSGHWCYSALTGLAVGLLLTRTRGDRRAAAVASAAVLTAIGAHFLHNVAGAVDPDFRVIIVLFTEIGVLLAFVVALRHARRAQWWRASAVLAGEAPGVCSRDGSAQLRTPRTARAARRATRRAHGRSGCRVHGRLQRAQIRLASARLAGEPADAARAVVLGVGRETSPSADGARQPTMIR